MEADNYHSREAVGRLYASSPLRRRKRGEVSLDQEVNDKHEDILYD